MKPFRRHIASVSCILLSLTAGCQRFAPSVPEPPQEAAKSATPDTAAPVEIAKIPDTPKPVPAKPTIRRIHPESALAAPDKDPASRQIAYDTLLSTRTAENKKVAGWQYRRNRQSKVVGFEFSNTGGNLILPPRRDALKNQFFTRDFQFRFDERARQDIHLLIADWVASRDRQFRLSELMNSLMHFFPRTTLPAIVNVGERNIITLPTGEEVTFDAATHEIRGGVLAESPVDLNPDRSARKFPGIEYKGKGVIVRANARGTDPRIGTTAVIFNGALVGATPAQVAVAFLAAVALAAAAAVILYTSIMVRIRWNQTGVERRDAQGKLTAIAWADVIKVQGRWSGIVITAADKRKVSFSPLQSGAAQLAKFAQKRALRNVKAPIPALWG